MGFLDSLIGVGKRAVQSIQDLIDIANPNNWMQKIREVFDALFRDLRSVEWSKASDQDKEEAVALIKYKVIHDLIPLAGSASLAGVPGIYVYTPCQVAGSLAIAYIYDREFGFSLNYILKIFAIMLWGKAGQITFVAVMQIIRDILPLPVIGIAVIPFVQTWTEIALNTVHSYFREKENNEKNVSVNSSSSNKVNNNNEEELIPKNSEAVKKAEILKERIKKGGKVLFSSQEEVFRELITDNNGVSVLSLGKVHTFRGVAGSGKTVILAQLVPHLIESFKEQTGREPKILIYHFNNYIHKLLEQEILSAIRAPIDINPLPDNTYRRLIEIHTLRTLLKKLRRDGVVQNIPEKIRNNKDLAENVLKSLETDKNIFDIIVMDESQDVSDSEFSLLIKLCQNFSTSYLSKSLYIFYDDFQNIFGNSRTVVQRLRSSVGLGEQQIIQHFLSRCIRTSKKIIDLTVNSCLGKRVDISSKIKLEESMGLDRLLERQLITMNSISNSNNQTWFDCKFCVFQGEAIPEVRNFDSMNKLLELLASDIEQIIHSWKELNKNFRSQNLEFNKHSVLIQCFTKDSVNEVSKHLTQKFNSEIVRRKSGDDIWTDRKRSNLAVEISCINIALVQDAKGYDADVVFVINPDECGGSSYDKRAKFYVASTRAKQFLAIYNSLSVLSSPIAQDAVDAFVYMNQREPF